MRIWFYDVSSSQELAHLNGKQLTFDELIEHHYECRKSWPELVLSPEKFLTFDFHPYGAGNKGWKYWGRYFSTAVQLLSGHCPSKEEIQIAKGFVMEFKRNEKERVIDTRFVLSFLPYLFIGLKIHRGNFFSEDSNRTIDVRNFVLSLWNEKNVIMSTFFCSHRDPKIGPKLNLLQTSIPEHKVTRSIAMLLAIMNNCPTLEKGRLIVLQQSPTIRATASIFPEVTVAYLEEGRVNELLSTVELQYRLINSVILRLNGGKVSLSLHSIDTISHRLERMMANRFGKEWRVRNFFPRAERKDPLVKIGIDYVLPSIKRLMPFFGGDYQSQFLSRVEELVTLNNENAGELAAIAERVVREFVHNHSLNVGAKAVYEAGFYYLWGRYCGLTSKAFAIGLDRDHDIYQGLAWSLGVRSVQRFYSYGQQQLLSARRNPSGREHGMLADLTFRQFWRNES